MATTSNLRIDYESEGFKSPAPVANGAGALLSTTWDDLLWAAVTVGRPNRNYVFRHGDASRYEAIFRWSLTRMALEQSGPSGYRLRKTEAVKTLDPSEKGAVNYFLGMTVSTLFADKLLDAPWAMHLDVCRPMLNALLRGRSRPDLVARTSAGDWIALESKGRVSAPSKDAKAKAKVQAQRLISVNGVVPRYNIGGITYFRHDILNFYWNDPEPNPEKANVIKAEIKESDWRFYYLPVFEIVQSSPELFKLMLREPILVPVPGLDLEVGIHPSVLELLAAGDWAAATRSLDRQTQYPFGYHRDGIRVAAGKSWKYPFSEQDSSPQSY